MVKTTNTTIYILSILLLLCIGIASPIFSREPSFVKNRKPSLTDSTLIKASASGRAPYLRDVVADEITGDYLARGEGDKRRFGTFVIENPDRVPFALFVKVANGGMMRRSGGGATYVRLRAGELRYKNSRDNDVVRSFMSAFFKAKGGVYEITFLPEDVQNVYNVELWGGVDVSNVEVGDHAIYEGKISLSTDVIR